MVFPNACSSSITLHNVYYLLSSLISSPVLNHHLYADDTQLFFSFHPCDFDSSITPLKSKKKVKGATYPYWGVGGVLISLPKAVVDKPLSL